MCLCDVGIFAGRVWCIVYIFKHLAKDRESWTELLFSISLSSIASVLRPVLSMSRFIKSFSSATHYWDLSSIMLTSWQSSGTRSAFTRRKKAYIIGLGKLRDAPREAWSRWRSACTAMIHPGMAMRSARRPETTWMMLGELHWAWEPGTKDESPVEVGKTVEMIEVLLESTWVLRGRARSVVAGK
jgi:hypothetical protein